VVLGQVREQEQGLKPVVVELVLVLGQGRELELELEQGQEVVAWQLVVVMEEELRQECNLRDHNLSLPK
jgi:hypothetical protein